MSILFDLVILLVGFILSKCIQKYVYYKDTIVLFMVKT